MIEMLYLWFSSVNMSDLVQVGAELREDLESKIAKLSELMQDSGEEYRLVDIGSGPIGNFRCQIVDVSSKAVKGMISMDTVDKRIRRALRTPIPVSTDASIPTSIRLKGMDLNEILFNSIQLINKMKTQLEIIERY